MPRKKDSPNTSDLSSQHAKGVARAAAAGSDYLMIHFSCTERQLVKI